MLHDQRGAKASREYIDQGIDDEAEWWRVLGGKGEVRSGDISDDEFFKPHGVARIGTVDTDSGAFTEVGVFAMLWH